MHIRVEHKAVDFWRGGMGSPFRNKKDFPKTGTILAVLKTSV
jgi:hypothetical protein